MKYILVIILIIFFACDNESNLTPEQLKTGTFKTYIDDSELTSVATRNKTFQIETFNQIKDTFLIKWKSNFEYSLFKKNPKNNLDSTEFIVKITGIHKNSYTFRAYYKGSNFKQKGKAIKLNENTTIQTNK
jgi:hypothetical protein